VSPASGAIAERLSQLRHSFDQAFADALPPEPPGFDDLLAIRVAGEPYAVRLTAISGLFVGWTVTQLPGPAAGLRGVAAYRGAIVPVYDLAMLLGYPRSEAPRWLVLTREASPVALAFDGVEGHLRVPGDTIAAGATETGDVVRTPAGARPVVDVHAVQAAIAVQVRSAAASRERQP